MLQSQSRFSSIYIAKSFSELSQLQRNNVRFLPQSLTLVQQLRKQMEESVAEESMKSDLNLHVPGLLLAYGDPECANGLIALEAQ